MEATNPEHAAALRHAITLRDYTDQLLNQDAAIGVEFEDVRWIVEDLYVNYPQASHLVGSGRPTHVPSRKEDAALHVLTLLAFVVADIPRTVRVIDSVRILQRFNRLGSDLIGVLTGSRWDF